MILSLFFFFKSLISEQSGDFIFLFSFLKVLFLSRVVILSFFPFFLSLILSRVVILSFFPFFKVLFLSRVVMEAKDERQLCGEASCINPDTNVSFLLGEDCTVIQIQIQIVIQIQIRIQIVIQIQIRIQIQIQIKIQIKYKYKAKPLASNVSFLLGEDCSVISSNLCFYKNN